MHSNCPDNFAEKSLFDWDIEIIYLVLTNNMTKEEQIVYAKSVNYYCVNY